MRILSARGLRTLVMAMAAGMSAPTLADTYAYEGNGNDGFGVLDITTGVFTTCGSSEVLLSGLGVGVDHALYGGGFQSNAFYAVDTANGNLTKVGTSNVTFFDTGSTTSGVYAVGTDANLYAIDTRTGQGTLIGATGVAIANGYYGMSTNARSLYYSHQGTLYSLNLKSGKAKLIGTATAGIFGAEVYEGGKLYAGSEMPLAIYTLDTKTGASTLVANETGANGIFWGLAPIKTKKISASKICAPHQI